MKIKRLTAGLAVAAMAAGFTLASPMLSAQAAAGWNYVNPGVSATAYNVANDTPPTTIIDLADILKSNSTFATNYVEPTVVTIGNMITSGHYSWLANGCTIVAGIPANASNPGTMPADLSVTNPIVGTCAIVPGTTKIAYTPGPNYGVTQPEQLYIRYALQDTSSTPFGIFGYLKLTVTTQSVGPCDNYTAGCLNYSVQAWTKGDKKTSVSVAIIAANTDTAATRKNAAFGFIPAATASSWRLVDDVNAPSGSALVALSASGNSFSNATIASWLQPARNDMTTLVFTPPSDWSGVVTYEYTIGKYDVSGFVPLPADPNVSAPSPATGTLTFTVKPTLTAPDLITSDDPTAAVSVPLLGKGTLPIIGSKSFKNASGVFASSGKTKDATAGTIKNGSGSTNPVYTPADGFNDSVDLSCTVQDTFGITSNAVTVTIQVGPVPAPAPVAPATTPAPACDNANGKCVLSVTGGSLAAPMSSGLAAVVLLVAAGAGILVVRRRTALAG